MTERTLKGWTDLAHTEPNKGTEWREVGRIKSNKRGCRNSNEREVEVWKRPGTKLKRWCTNSEVYHKAESSYVLNVLTLLFPNISKMLWPYFGGYHYHHNYKHMEVKEQEREVTEWTEGWNQVRRRRKGRDENQRHMKTIWRSHTGRYPGRRHSELLTVGVCPFCWGILLLGGLIGFCLSSETGMIRWI